MLIVISKEQLAVILEEEIKCWESVSGGPNLNAFSFDPKETDPKVLKELGYYTNRESWIAGAIFCIIYEGLGDGSIYGIGNESKKEGDTKNHEDLFIYTTHSSICVECPNVK
jgi:hypothetical protein